MGGQLPDPAHAVGGRLRVVAELFRHAARTAADAELPYRAPDRFGYRLDGRGVRPLEFRREQGLAPRVGQIQHVHGIPRTFIRRLPGTVPGCPSQLACDLGALAWLGRPAERAAPEVAGTSSAAAAGIRIPATLSSSSRPSGLARLPIAASWPQSASPGQPRTRGALPMALGPLPDEQQQRPVRALCTMRM